MHSRHVLMGVAPFLSSLLLSSIVGLVVPSVLIHSGFSPFLTAMFTLALFALMIDGLLTKLSLGGSVQEINPIMAFFMKRLGGNFALVLSRACGLAVLVYGLLILQNPYMLLVVAWLFFMLILASTTSMLFVNLRTKSKVAKDRD